MQWLSDQPKCGPEKAKRIWSEIGDLVVQTVMLGQPKLDHLYKSCFPEDAGESRSRCFEVLGFDVMLDHMYKPILIEVNHSPSFNCGTYLDER